MTRMTILLSLLVVPALASAASLDEPWRISDSSNGPLVSTAIPAGTTPGHPAPAGLRSWPATTLSTVVSPVFADLDGDGMLEVVTADDRYAYAFSTAGALLWQRDIGGANMHAAVADLDGDRIPEIMIGSNFPGPRLWVLDPAGNPKPGWPVSLPYTTLANVTSPVVADLDGDGRREVGVATENGVSFIRADGTVPAGWPYLWPVPINNPQWSAPAVGDVDGDGAPEIAVGNADYPDWGVHLIRADGTAMPGWPKVIEPVWSSPALADLDGDGHLEIIAQEGDPGSLGYRMWVWHHDGSVAAGWPRAIAVEGNSSRSSPAVGDLDGDGVLEIITATGDGLLHILRPNGAERPGWPRPTGGVQPVASAAVIDMDGDSIEEIFLTYWRSEAQYVSGWHLDGSVVAGFPKLLYSGTDLNSHSSTHLADPNGDGVLDLTVSGSSIAAGRVWVLAVDASVVGPATRRDWPKMRRDLENRACFCEPEPAVVAEPAGGAPVVTPLTVQPNPAFAADRIVVGGLAGEPGELAVFDVAGRLLGRRAIEPGAIALPAAELIGSRSGIVVLRWDPLGSGAARSARLVILAR